MNDCKRASTHKFKIMTEVSICNMKTFADLSLRLAAPIGNLAGKMSYDDDTSSFEDFSNRIPNLQSETDLPANLRCCPCRPSSQIDG